MFQRINEYFERLFSRLLEPEPPPIRTVRRMKVDERGNAYVVMMPTDTPDEGTEIQQPVSVPLRVVAVPKPPIG